MSIRPVACSTTPFDGPPITQIAWDASDALPFPLCLSVTAKPGSGGQRRAREHPVLVDHGPRSAVRRSSLPPEALEFAGRRPSSASCCDKPEPVSRRRRASAAALSAVSRCPTASISRRCSRCRSAPTRLVAAAALASINPRTGRRDHRLAGEFGTVQPDTGAAARPAGERGRCDRLCRRDRRMMVARGFGSVTTTTASARSRHRLRATYRHGNGIAGNVGAEAIATL